MQEWAEAIAGYAMWLAAAGASAGTIRLRRNYLGRLAERCDCGPWAVELDTLACFCATPGWKPETRKSARASVRGFYRWGLDTERIERDPSRRLPTVRVPAGVPRPTPDTAFARAMLAAGPRETLMVMFAAYAGLRRSEIARVHTDDIMGGELRVLGKGGRVRMIPLHPRLVTALGDVPAGWVFPGQIDGHISPGHVGVLLARLLGPGWSGHTLRHRFATRAYAAERDLRAVQLLLGHSKPETTARYTAVPDQARMTAVLAAA